MTTSNLPLAAPPVAPPTSPPNVPPARANAWWLTFWKPIRTLIKKPVGLIGLVGVLIVMFFGLLGPYLFPIPLTNVDIRLQAPSADHLLGTDNYGKDIGIQILRGGQDELIVGLLAAAIVTVIGVTAGSLAAYLGGFLDRAIVSVGNFLLTIPTFVLLVVLSTIVHLDNSVLLAGLIGLLSWPTLMRTTRAQVLSLRERDYIEAAAALDLGTSHIIVREILPNLASYILINAIFAVTSAIYQMNALVLLGFVPISVRTANWGIMINIARSQGALLSSSTAWWILAPVFMIALLQWLLSLLARSIEDVFNPRLKSS